MSLAKLAIITTLSFQNKHLYKWTGFFIDLVTFPSILNTATLVNSLHFFHPVTWIKVENS